MGVQLKVPSTTYLKLGTTARNVSPGGGLTHLWESSLQPKLVVNNKCWDVGMLVLRLGRVKDQHLGNPGKTKSPPPKPPHEAGETRDGRRPVERQNRPYGPGRPRLA